MSIFNLLSGSSGVLAFLQENLIAVILGALILILIIVLIVLIVKCRKLSALYKEEQQNVSESAEVEPVKTEETPAVQEETEVIVVEDIPEEEIKLETENKVEEKPVAPVSDAVEAPEATKNTAPVKKTAIKKTTTKKTEEKKIIVTGQKPKGKWTVEFKKDGEYMAKLYASNGEEMLSSEIYTTEEGARNGIVSIINSIDTGKFVIYQDKAKNYYYKLKTSTNRFMCVGEIYKSKERCQKAVDSVKRIAKDAVVSPTLVTGTEYVDYKPIKNPKYEVKNGATGKWKIEQNEEGMYSAKLYASNGQLMLATEEVSLLKSAENAIESVKKNAAAGHFIIDRDKFGKYYYKLRNAKKSVICIGEAYTSVDSCISALESVRRFAATAIEDEE